MLKRGSIITTDISNLYQSAGEDSCRRGDYLHGNEYTINKTVNSTEKITEKNVVKKIRKVQTGDEIKAGLLSLIAIIAAIAALAILRRRRSA